LTLDIDLKKNISRENGIENNVLRGSSLVSSPRDFELPPIVSSFSNKVKGVIPLEKQTLRPDPLIEAKRKKITSRDRFSIDAWPANFSANTKLQSINIGKTSPRKEIHNVDTVSGSLYQPNFEYVKKRFNQFDTLMGKVTGRKPVEKKTLLYF